jgi:hypothetical protein
MKTKIFLTFLVRRSFSVGVFFLLFTFYLFSQAPQGFNYQAVARDGDNNVLKNTGLDVKIGLHQGSETGTLVWEEIHSVTTNEVRREHKGYRDRQDRQVRRARQEPD